MSEHAHEEPGLFAEPPRTRVPTPRRPTDRQVAEPVMATNDMDVVEDVLKVATTGGYADVAGRVCRNAGSELEPVGKFEAAVVGQLISTGLLRLGRVRKDGVRPVEVLESTKALASRLRAYRRPSSAGVRRGLATPRSTEGRR